MKVAVSEAGGSVRCTASTLSKSRGPDPQRFAVEMAHWVAKQRDQARSECGLSWSCLNLGLADLGFRGLGLRAKSTFCC